MAGFDSPSSLTGNLKKSPCDHTHCCDLVFFWENSAPAMKMMVPHGIPQWVLLLELGGHHREQDPSIRAHIYWRHKMLSCGALTLATHFYKTTQKKPAFGNSQKMATHAVGCVNFQSQIQSATALMRKASLLACQSWGTVLPAWSKQWGSMHAASQQGGVLERCPRCKF